MPTLFVNDGRAPNPFGGNTAQFGVVEPDPHILDEPESIAHLGKSDWEVASPEVIVKNSDLTIPASLTTQLLNASEGQRQCQVIFSRIGGWYRLVRAQLDRTE